MRARNLKPGFFTNEELVELPFEARLLFAGLWCMADREGRLQDRPKRVKIEIFPADDVDVDKCLVALATRKLILRYVIDGTQYIQIVNFHKHQHPHKTEKPSVIPAPLNNGALTVVAPLANGSRPAESLLLNPESRILNPECGFSARKDFEEIQSAYPKRSGEDGWLLGEREYYQRIEEGADHEEILAGVRRYADYCKATQAIGTQFVLAPRRFFAERKYREAWKPPATKTEQREEACLDAARGFLEASDG